jgi:hypothetical protein
MASTMPNHPVVISGLSVKLAVPQPGQQVLSHMSDLFEFVESEETARALNGMNGAKYRSQRVFVLRALFETNQLAVQAVEILIALDQKNL